MTPYARYRKLARLAKPCPRCGTAPAIGLGFADSPFPEGQEYFSCPAVFLDNVHGNHSCATMAQGLHAWNHQPLLDDLRTELPITHSKAKTL